jgi:hypothetical protein
LEGEKMLKIAAHNVVDFEQLQLTSAWVRHLLTEHAGVYLAETGGFISIWLVNPEVLTQLPANVAHQVAETVDEVTNEFLSETHLAEDLITVFRGCTIDANTLQDIHTFLEHRLAGQMDEQGGFVHRLEVALTCSLYHLVDELSGERHL